MSGWSRIVFCLSCVFVSTSLIGCATFDSSFGKKMPRATASDPAVQVVCLWQPGEGRDPDGVPCKGFLGQIMFLSQRASTPVVIEGDVRIYLFDDQGTPEEQAKPLHEFDFLNGSWGMHLTSTSYGPAYSVFIPYVRRGVANAACSLRLRFKPKQGHPIFSEFTNMQLSGPRKTSTGDDAKPLTKEEIDRQTVDALTGSLLRTTTIATGANSKSLAVSPATKKEADSSQIQQASHQVSAASANETVEADRIRRLESMVEKLLERQTASPATPPAPTRTRQDMIPADASEQSSPAESIGGSQKGSRRLRIRHNEDEAPVRSSPVRRAHPLDDDQPVSSRPAADDEQNQEPPIGEAFDAPVETTYLPRSSAGQRYRRSAR